MKLCISINCIIVTGGKETAIVKDFISSQISEYNREVLNKCQACEKGFDELVDWELEYDYIVSIQFIEPSHDNTILQSVSQKNEFC